MNMTQFKDVLLIEGVILIGSSLFGLGGFVTVLFFEIIYTLCWIADHS